MSLNRIKECVGRKHYKCELCFKDKKNAPYFKLLPHPAIVKLLVDKEERTVCNLCAMKEEFGSNYRQNRRYRDWIE